MAKTASELREDVRWWEEEIRIRERAVIEETEKRKRLVEEAKGTLGERRRELADAERSAQR